MLMTLVILTFHLINILLLPAKYFCNSEYGTLWSTFSCIKFPIRILGQPQEGLKQIFLFIFPSKIWVCGWAVVKLHLFNWEHSWPHGGKWKWEWDTSQGQEHYILHAVTLTQVVKPSVHDARFGGVDCLDLVSAQRPSWQSVVVLMPAFETLKPHFGTASQQPLCCSSVRTHSFDPFIVHPERRSTNTQYSTYWWRHVMWLRLLLRGQKRRVSIKCNWQPAHQVNSFNLSKSPSVCLFCY